MKHRQKDFLASTWPGENLLTDCANDGSATIILLWLEFRVQISQPFEPCAPAGHMVQSISHCVSGSAPRSGSCIRSVKTTTVPILLGAGLRTKILSGYSSQASLIA